MFLSSYESHLCEEAEGYRCEAVGARLQRLFRLVHIKGRQAGLEEIVVGKSVPTIEGVGRIKATSARGLACGDTSDVAKNNEESIPPGGNYGGNYDS